MKDIIKKYTLGLYEKAVPAGLELGQKLEFIARCSFDFMELSIDENRNALPGAAEKERSSRNCPAAFCP